MMVPMDDAIEYSPVGRFGGLAMRRLAALAAAGAPMMGAPSPVSAPQSVIANFASAAPTMHYDAEAGGMVYDTPPSQQASGYDPNDPIFSQMGGSPGAPGSGMAINPRTGRLEQVYSIYGQPDPQTAGPQVELRRYFESDPDRPGNAQSLAGYAPGYYSNDNFNTFDNFASRAIEILGLAGLGAGAGGVLPAEGAAAAGGTVADATVPAVASGGGASSVLSTWTPADALASEDALAGQAMNNYAASQGTILGDPTAGTGPLWQGNTFNGSGAAIPFGAPGDIMPGGEPVNVAPASVAPAVPAPVAEAPAPAPNPSGAAPEPSMFDSIAKGVGTALGVGGLLNAGANLLGGKLQADAASDAARIQSDATDRATAATAKAAADAIAEQRRQYDTNRDDLAPYRAAGTTALTNLGAGVGPDGLSGALTRKFTLDDFWKDPVVQAGYQSGLDLGTKALRNAAPLTTGIDSGAAMKELTKFGTDYTGNMAAGSYGRFVGDQGNQFNKEAALAGIGQAATNTGVSAGTATAGNIAQTGMTAGTNIANLMSGQGNAGAAARIGGANAWTGALNNISNWWQSQDLLNRLQSMPRQAMSGISNWASPAYTGYGAQGDYQYG
jgi:hypothetical protein